MSLEMSVLSTSAAGIAVLHTLLGPDHYLPFVALAAARGWSALRLVVVTGLCGLAHVGASVGLAAGATAVGWSLTEVTGLDDVRGTLAAWLLVAFGVLYAWRGLARRSREHAHAHEHVHADGTRHEHAHNHRREHLHPHATTRRLEVTAWALFLVFLFGPCEPLVPLLVAPAATGGVMAVAVVASVFAAATLATMIGVVLVARYGLARLVPAGWHTHTNAHVAAGATIACCGLAMLTLGL
jgi:sulfite exporter TauE/SafE